jgi:hypothetical protein
MPIQLPGVRLFLLSIGVTPPPIRGEKDGPGMGPRSMLIGAKEGIRSQESHTFVDYVKKWLI